MIEIGKINKLTVIKVEEERGCYLDGKKLGEIFMPRSMGPQKVNIGDQIQAFVYHDSDSVLIATTSRPIAQVGQCAFLQVVATSPIGAFLDWGLPKDLLVPSIEQYSPLRKGKSYVVYIYLDSKTNRVAASAKIHSYLKETGEDLQPGQQVELLVCGSSDLGYKAVINNTYLGLIYKNEIFKPIAYGQKLTGYIKNIRDDQKIDLTLQPPGMQGLDSMCMHILEQLKKQRGVSYLTDSSPAEKIAQEMGISKSKYKKALGRLYKQQKIVIEKDRIVLN